MQQLRSFLNAATPELLLVLVAAAIYLVGLLLGRLGKRRLSIRLGWTYQIFILSVAIGAAALILQIQLPGARAIGLIAVFTAAFPLNALLDRFFWPLYGYPGERARIPSSCPKSSRSSSRSRRFSSPWDSSTKSPSRVSWQAPD